MLIVGDRPTDSALVVDKLRQHGFDVEWHRVEHESDYLARLSPELDVIVVDDGLLQVDARRAIALAKDRNLDVPIVVAVAALGDEAEALVSRWGATDCVVKPHLPLLAHVVERARTHRRLRHEQTQLRRRLDAFVENSYDALALIGDDLRVRYASPSIRRVMGIELNDFVGHEILEFVHADDHEQVRRAYDALRRDPTRTQASLIRHRHGDGSWRLVEITRRNLLAEPSVRAIVVNFRDVTERETAQNALQQSASRYRGLFERVPIGLYLTRTNGTFVDANPAFLEMLGYPDRATLRGINATSLYVDPGARERLTEALERDGVVTGWESALRRRDGTILWGRANVRAVHDPTGEGDGLEGAIIDITDQRAAETALRDNEQRFRALIEHGFDIILLLDRRGIIQYASPSAERVLGYEPDALLGRDRLELVHPDDRAELRHRFASLVEHPDGQAFTQARLRHRDGTWRWTESVATNLLHDSSVQAVVANYRDITVRKLAEEENQRRAAHLETINAIVAAAVSARDLGQLLEHTVDLTLHALGHTMGGIWIGTEHRGSGMSADVGPSILRAAASLGQVLDASEAVADARAPDAHGLASVMKGLGILAWIAAPIRAGGRAIGGIAVASPVPCAWRPDETALVETVGRQIGEAAERLDLLQRAERRTAELLAVTDLGRRLREAASVTDMYPIIVEHAMQVLASEHGALALLNEDEESFTRVYARGVSTEPPGSTFPAAGSRSMEVVRTGIPRVAKDIGEEQRPPWMDHFSYRDFGPYLVVAVRSEAESIGTLTLLRRKTGQDRSFSEDDVRVLMGIAEIAGSAIRRGRLQQSLEQSYIEMVLALARAVDARDSYTGDHSERIAARAVATARALGCTDDETQTIHWAALLHDIGKLSVPDQILKKPSPLTAAEWDVMREHPTIGEQILRPIERMHGVAAIIRHHHERWDGTGYPDRLQGDEIPLGARILAVADAYSAIIDTRAYDAGRPKNEAIAEIRQCASTQFDPAVADVFCRVIEHADAAIVPVAEMASAGNESIRSLASAVVQPFQQNRHLRRAAPAVADVAQRLLRPLDLTAVLEAILSQIQSVFGYPICGVLLLDERTRELRVAAQRGFDPDVVTGLRLRVGEQGIAGWVAQRGRSYYAPDVTLDSLYVAGSSSARSNVAFPLMVDDRTIGVLDVESPSVDAFPKETREFLATFAVLAALAILRAQRDENLSELARTDGLTGLANHRAILQDLEREIVRARRSGHPVSVALVEIDGFKRLNDKFGHLQGDLVLREVADVLRRHSRAGDLVGRFGGDEFVLVLPQATKNVAAQIVERVRGHVEEIRVPGNERTLSVSIGLAAHPADGDDPDGLLESADHAMYQAKRNGGNRVCVA